MPIQSINNINKQNTRLEIEFWNHSKAGEIALMLLPKAKGFDIDDKGNFEITFDQKKVVQAELSFGQSKFEIEPKVKGQLTIEKQGKRTVKVIKIESGLKVTAAGISASLARIEEDEGCENGISLSIKKFGITKKVLENSPEGMVESLKGKIKFIN